MIDEIPLSLVRKARRLKEEFEGRISVALLVRRFKLSFEDAQELKVYVDYLTSDNIYPKKLRKLRRIDVDKS